MVLHFVSLFPGAIVCSSPLSLVGPNLWKYRQRWCNVDRNDWPKSSDLSLSKRCGNASAGQEVYLEKSCEVNRQQLFVINAVTVLGDRCHLVTYYPPPPNSVYLRYVERYKVRGGSEVSFNIDFYPFQYQITTHPRCKRIAIVGAVINLFKNI